MNQKINIKIMKKPELTDEEIRSHMQFDKVFEAYKATGPVNDRINWKPIAAFTISAILIISITLYFFLPGSKKMNESAPKETIVPSLDSSLNSKKEKAIEPIQKNELPEQRKTITVSPASIKKESLRLPLQEKKFVPSQFTEAEPVEGYPALYEYFDRELKYPTEAASDSIEGVVTVSFAINTEGKPAQIKIENSLGAPFDKECERIIMAMPMWKPATINGKPIATRLSIPLTFKTQSVKH